MEEGAADDEKKPEPAPPRIRQHALLLKAICSLNEQNPQDEVS